MTPKTDGGFDPSLQNILTTLLLVLLVLFAISALDSKTPLLAVVKGVSMLPTLREGDIVFLKSASPGDIRVGDVVVYTTPRGELVIHRVIGVVVDHETNTYYYRTEGDNNVIEDLPNYERGLGVPYSRIVGKVVEFNGYVFKIPYLGYITLLLRSLRP
ncbi:MAG: signal peptidase I [Desulfurococcus sp.]|nr:signal peptidase I [Desulfurococcus sp.]